MATLTVELDEGAVGRLRRRAEREGVDPATLAARIITEATAEQDPFDFAGSFASDATRGRDSDQFLADHGFGES